MRNIYGHGYHDWHKERLITRSDHVENKNFMYLHILHNTNHHCTYIQGYVKYVTGECSLNGAAST